jgi:hypothetical protein
MEGHPPVAAAGTGHRLGKALLSKLTVQRSYRPIDYWAFPNHISIGIDIPDGLLCLNQCTLHVEGLSGPKIAWKRPLTIRFYKVTELLIRGSHAS